MGYKQIFSVLGMCYEDRKKDTRLVDRLKDGVKNVITETANPSTRLLSSKFVNNRINLYSKYW